MTPDDLILAIKLALTAKPSRRRSPAATKSARFDLIVALVKEYENRHKPDTKPDTWVTGAAPIFERGLE